jgi:hypothetical protein
MGYRDELDRVAWNVIELVAGQLETGILDLLPEDRNEALAWLERRGAFAINGTKECLRDPTFSDDTEAELQMIRLAIEVLETTFDRLKRVISDTTSYEEE